MPFTLQSSAFADGAPIPRQYSCEADSLSPPLEWDAPPAGTQSFALLVQDPDAPHGIVTHWVLYGLPATTRAISENVIPGQDGPDGSLQGQNSHGESGYTGPCPPTGENHRYVFNLYALDSAVELAAGATGAELVGELSARIIAEAQLVGTYQKHAEANPADYDDTV